MSPSPPPPLPPPFYPRPVVPLSRALSSPPQLLPTNSLVGLGSGPRDHRPGQLSKLPNQAPALWLLCFPVPPPGCWQNSPPKPTHLGLKGSQRLPPLRKDPNSLATVFDTLQQLGFHMSFQNHFVHFLSLGFPDCGLSYLHQNFLGPWLKMENPEPYPRELNLWNQSRRT